MTRRPAPAATAASPPLVSCLMVTQPGREHLASEAVADFHVQDWPDRELVIVSDGAAAPHRDWLAAAARDGGGRVRAVLVPPGMPLGALRNLALDHAAGEILLQWDDDDRYAPGRIAAQAGPLVADPTCAGTCLTTQLYWFIAARRLYWVDWRNRRPRFDAIRIPGTLCVRAAAARGLRYPELGPHASRGEDGAFLADVCGRGAVAELDAALGTFYVRRFHGSNTWDLGRFVANARWLGRTAAELALPDGRAAVAVARPLLGPGAVHVEGRDAPAYTLAEGCGDGPA